MRYLSLLLIVFSFKILAAQEITVMTYHDDPPFVISIPKEIGLTYSVSRELSRRSKGRYDFKVVVLPRRRLDYLLRSKTTTVVPWTTPIWFKDKSMKKYNWSLELIAASNVIISRNDKPIEYEKLDDLKGLSIVGLRGGRWPKLEHWVKSGAVTRYDSATYRNAIEMVAKGRVDAARLPIIAAKYQAVHSGFESKIYFSKKPLDSINRRFLIKGDKELVTYINTQLREIKKSLFIEKTLQNFMINN